jgi:hypothetical protein
MTSQEANLAQITKRYRDDDELVSAARALLNRPPRNDFERNLEQRLRNHFEREVTLSKEIELREGVDRLLSFYSILEIAIVGGLISPTLPEHISREAESHLGNRHVRRYYERHYPLLLPQLLHLRGRAHGIAPIDGHDRRAFAAFSSFLDTSDGLCEPDARRFLGMLDDFWWKRIGLPDLVSVLRSPERTARHLGGEGAAVLVSATVGFGSFLQFATRLDRLLQRTRTWSPLLASAFWHHHAYWFVQLKSRLSWSFEEILKAIRAWPDSKPGDVQPFDEVIRRLLDDQNGEALQRAFKESLVVTG